MKIRIIIFSFLFCTFNFAQDVLVKSLQVYSGNDPLSIPLVISSKGLKQNLTIEFDIAANYEPNIVLEFKLCDLNWVPYSNIFLLNQGQNTTQTLWFESIRIPNSGASYHYKGSFPNFDITFPFPGKWIFVIRDSMNKNKIYEQGAFYVLHNSIPLKTRTTRETFEGPAQEKVELNRVLSMEVNFVLPDSLFPSNVVGVEIIENRKFFSPVQIGKINTGLRNFYFDGGHNFTFNARDIFPGNGYRSLDIRDRGKYSFPAANAKFEGVDVTEYYNYKPHDLVGGEIITNYRNDNSQYLKVKFRLRPPENLNRKIFLVGAFTNWLVLPQYEMKNENGLLTLDVELKRGEYDYQYVLGDDINGTVTNVDWHTLEGNFWETDNDYHIFVYYFTPDKGGYNKIIGYKKNRNGGL